MLIDARPHLRLQYISWYSTLYTSTPPPDNGKIDTGSHICQSTLVKCFETLHIVAMDCLYHTPQFLIWFNKHIPSCTRCSKMNVAPWR